MISATPLCGHKNGGLPTSCEAAQFVTSEILCRNACTNLPTCVGYAYSSTSQATGCNLYPSVNECPGGYILVPGTLAKIASDLTAPATAVGQGDVCYGLNPGKKLSICY